MQMTARGPTTEEYEEELARWRRGLGRGEFFAFATPRGVPGDSGYPITEPGVVTNAPSVSAAASQMGFPVRGLADTEQRPPGRPSVGRTLGYPDVLARWRMTGEDKAVNPAGTASAAQIIRRRFAQSNPNAVSPSERAQIQAEIAQEQAMLTPGAAEGEPGQPVLSEDGKWIGTPDWRTGKMAWKANPYVVEETKIGGRQTLQQQRLDQQASQFAKEHGLDERKFSQAREEFNRGHVLDIAELARKYGLDANNLKLALAAQALAERRVAIEERMAGAAVTTTTEGEVVTPFGGKEPIKTTVTKTTALPPGESPTGTGKTATEDEAIGRSFDALEKDIADGKWDDPRNLARARKLKQWLDVNPKHPFAIQARRILNQLNENDLMPKEKPGAAK